MMKWPGKRRKTAIADWLKFATDKELEVLIALADLGTLPPEAQSLFAEIQTRAETSLKTTLALPSPDNVTVPPDTSFADWLRFKWRSADASVRHTLRTVAEALGVPVPMSRTRKSSVGGKDSSGSQRTEPDQHPNHGESVSTESSPEKEEPGYLDPPQWHDDHADGWEPCESLHDAMHPEDRGWY